MNKKSDSSHGEMLCVNGCGFYGCDDFDGLCSKCYSTKHKERLKQNGKVNETYGKFDDTVCGLFVGKFKPNNNSSAVQVDKCSKQTVVKETGERKCSDGMPVEGIDDSKCIDLAKIDSENGQAKIKSKRKNRLRCNICSRSIAIIGEFALLNGVGIDLIMGGALLTGFAVTDRRIEKQIDRDTDR